MFTPGITPLSLVLLSATLPAPALPAQTAPSPSPAIAFSKARALYYTPVDQGLDGFHCELGFDWKTFMEKAGNQSVPDDDSRLKYLRSIQLSVDDDLHSGGEVYWTAPAPPPDDAESSVDKIRGGFQQLWSGFFQTWNGFLTGDIVTLDAKSTVEHTAAGFHVAAANGPGTAEEQYDNNLLLQKVHVTTPTLDSIVMPSFSPTPQGLLVSSIRSTYRQPPTSEPTDVLMKVSYAAVSNFQVPSEVIVSVGPAIFDFHLLNCTVKSKITQK